MKFTLTIDCDNAAFTDDGEGEVEVARILRRAASRIYNGESSGNVQDLNGNTVGHFDLEHDE